MKPRKSIFRPDLVSGDVVIHADNISKGFGDRLLINDLSFKLPPGGIVGIIGPNGAGKTTLFRMMAGLEQPDSGALTIGQTVQLSYVDQLRDDMNPNNTVFEEISDGLDIITVGKYETPSRAYVGRFNFKGADQQKTDRRICPAASATGCIWPSC